MQEVLPTIISLFSLFKRDFFYVAVIFQKPPVTFDIRTNLSITAHSKKQHLIVYWNAYTSLQRQLLEIFYWNAFMQYICLKHSDKFSELPHGPY
jgi:hypothetical protein